MLDPLHPTDGALPGPGDEPRLLSALLGDGIASPEPIADVRITSIVTHSNDVVPGSLFVALRGSRTDGHLYVDDAIARGAAAVVVEDGVRGESRGVGVPIIRVESTRRTLAEVAARYHGCPAERLSLIGITGTVGKTSVLTMLEAILAEAGSPIGVVGSLGLRIGGETVKETGVTSPDPLGLHQALARIVREGGSMAAMEVTSHALVQERVHGLQFDLGVMTNLVPLEHSDYHGSFRNYVEAKRHFLDLVRDCAPFIYSAHDLTVRRLAHDSRLTPVGCGTARSATVRIETSATTAEGTRLTLKVRRPLPRLSGGEVAPLRLPLRLHLLGRSNVANAALAATAALCIGIDPVYISTTLPAFPPPRRRMEIIHRGRFTVLDDTVGHPDSISVVFEVAEALLPARCRVVYAVRGNRGGRINGQVGEALSVWAGRLPVGTLVITRSVEATDDRNHVTESEYSAFLAPLRKHGIPFVERERLDDAVRMALDSAGDGDLVLLLGAQGMDTGQAIMRDWLGKG
jgi:UDP-N-acetylmuramoyl-L-alanyl-D-glutamate--2,6-diaminopimelate ligase